MKKSILLAIAILFLPFLKVQAGCLDSYAFDGVEHAQEYKEEVREATSDVYRCSRWKLYKLVKVHLKHGNKEEAVKVLGIIIKEKKNIQPSDFDKEKYSEVGKLLKAPLFLKTKEGKIYTNRLEKYRARNKLAIEKINSDNPLYKPDKDIFIYKDTPELMYCFEDRSFKVIADITLYEKPNSVNISGVIIKGTMDLEVLSVEQYVRPVPTVVGGKIELESFVPYGKDNICVNENIKLDGRKLSLDDGDIYYILKYHGELVSSYWYKGCEYVGTVYASEMCLFGEQCYGELIFLEDKKEIPCGQNNGDWWIKVKYKDNKGKEVVGWIDNNSSVNFLRTNNPCY